MIKSLRSYCTYNFACYFFSQYYLILQAFFFSGSLKAIHKLCSHFALKRNASFIWNSSFIGYPALSLANLHGSKWGEGRGGQRKEDSLSPTPPLPPHPPKASDHSSQAELLSEFRFSLCLNSLSALPLLAHVGLKPPALASPGCLTSLWFCERCPHHCKWSPSGIFLQLPTLSTLTAVYWCTYPQWL